jgi:CRISPR-associated protein Cas2
VRVLVAYDVSTVDAAGERRLRQVARACQDFGQRVQKSLFECRVGTTEWTALRQRLLDAIDASADSLRFYFLEADVRVEKQGVEPAWDLDGPLVI